MILQAVLPTPELDGELAAATLEATITVLLSALCFMVWRRSREPHFGWWTVAFALFATRIGAIIAFVATRDRSWLFWHQVITGWTALALLWAALTFARRAIPSWTRWALVAFPPVWSYVAVIKLDNFTLAAVPAVLFIAGASAATGVILLRKSDDSTKFASRILGWSFIVWGVHHLDYPLLRAQGAWLPWGYYLDILFLLSVGAGILLLVNAELTARLHARTTDLERLSQRMVRHHEEERRRLSMALHDETAQVFAAVKMQLGVVRELVAPTVADRLDRALGLFDEGIAGVRAVTRDLRPALLDDLGLLPALRSLVAEFGERHGLAISLDAPETVPVLSEEGELAIFRALQESLVNVSRHAPSSAVRVTVSSTSQRIALIVEDDGPGLKSTDAIPRAEAAGRMGIAGMRERVFAVGGTMDVRPAAGGGLRVAISMPTAEGTAA